MTTWTADTWINRGAERIATDPELGQRLISHGLQFCPDQGVGWFNLGLAMHQQRRIPAAIRAYRHALRCSNPPVIEATNNLAQDLLLHGEFEEGWNLYEQRFLHMGRKFSTYIELYGPAWGGFSDPRACDTLLLVSEQGLGDTLQFCRLISSLQELGLNTSLFCHEALAHLLRSSSSIGDISLILTNHSPGIRWCPLLSLPQRLGIHLHNIPLSKGYLTPEPERVARWGAALKRKPGHKLIALHWQGNPKFERKLYSLGRSMPFEAWLGLKHLPNLEFLSIQKGDGRKQLRTDAGLPFVAGQTTFDASYDFRDTAAALANCDLVLSADSSVVHLAGALGKPTWVALSWIPEWRWGLKDKCTPWYESVRLFRQPRMGDWQSVVSDIAFALQATTRP